MNGLSAGKYVPSSPICTEPFNSKYTVEEDIGRKCLEDIHHKERSGNLCREVRQILPSYIIRSLAFPFMNNQKTACATTFASTSVLDTVGGKFAVVRRCINLETGEVVAAKFIRKRRKGKSCREEILREVVMLELAMAHSRLVSLREVFETQTELILVTEYCSGGELFDECVIKESFKEDDVRGLLVQILEGLAYLHDKNIVHLDLKPQNILLTKPFPEGEIKICDLGFACLTNTGEDIRDIIGTPDYVAPEVLDYEPLNIQTDMWSLGVLTYVMLTACSPFAGNTQQETFCNITQVKLDFPDDLFGHINPLAKDFIEKLLVKKPRDRLTARQCLDHPWLRDLKHAMSISVPSPDHTKELANEMVVPSNWHMSPDRRTSISDIESLPFINVLSDLESKTVFTGSSTHCKLSEDKDIISKTLSHIDIDKSSSASFETCPESIYGSPRKISSETLFDANIQPDSLSVLTASSDENFVTLSSDVHKSVCNIFESERSDFDNTLAQIEISKTFSKSESVSSLEFHSLSSFNILDKSIELSGGSSTDNCMSDSFSSAQDAKRVEILKKRMSVEIPIKKAKCIQDVEDTSTVPSENNLTLPLNLPEQSDIEGQCTEHDRQECNGLEDIRNAV